MRPVAAGVLMAWFLLMTWCTSATADGGTLRLSAKQGAYQISVFTAPTPFRAGPVDISVLVQDSLTGEPVPVARVIVRMSKSGQPALEYPATAQAATNKLFRAALFELPEPGRWDMQVRVEGSRGLAEFAGELEAAQPLPRWREIWPWFSWPLLVIALFGLHQVFARTEHRQSGLPPRGRGDRVVPTILKIPAKSVE
jgi:hypothetical protein